MEEDRSPNGTFTQVPNMLLDSCDLPETAQLLFFKLLRRVGHTGGVFVGSTRKLAKLTNMSKSTVDRGLKTLAKANLLTIGHQISSETEQEVMKITLNMDDIWSVNRYHSKVAPVPIWDNMLPNLDTLPQIGTEHPELGMGELVVSVNSTQEDSKKILNTNKTEEDTALTLSSEAQFIFDCCQEDGEYDPKLETRVIGYCKKIAEHIHTREQYNSLRDFTRPRIKGEDKTVYLGNMASSKNINAWLKTQACSSLPDEGSPLPGPMPEEVYKKSCGICHQQYFQKLSGDQKLIARFEEVYHRFPSKQAFMRALDEASSKEMYFENFFKRLEALCIDPDVNEEDPPTEKKLPKLIKLRLNAICKAYHVDAQQYEDCLLEQFTASTCDQETFKSKMSSAQALSASMEQFLENFEMLLKR